MSQSPKTKAQGSRTKDATLQTKDATARNEEPLLNQSSQASSSQQAPQEIPDSQVIAGNTEFGNRYPKAYKIKILQESDACTKPGELGQFLRQAGLTHATLTAFRKQRAAGTLEATDMPKSTRANKNATQNQNADQNQITATAQRVDQVTRVMELERQNRQLQRKLQQAEAILEIQKKVLLF